MTRNSSATLHADGDLGRLSAPSAPQFSVCTLVTRRDEYDVMRASFQRFGFTDEVTEYLIVDNSNSNRLDAYQAINLFLLEASAPYIIVCHQDVELIDDGFDDLLGRLGALERRDPTWAVVGNAGSSLDGRLAMRISDPHASNQVFPGLPVRVNALDENFLLIKRAANLGLSRDLHGFHHYGNDACIIADVLGWSCYVIDFHLLHKSGGSMNSGYFASRRKIIGKYRRAFRPRIVAGTLQRPYVVGGARATGAIGGLMLRLLKYSFIARRLIGMPPKRDAFG